MPNQAKVNTVSRRHFLQITAVAGSVFLGGRWLNRIARQPSTISQTRLLMGTFINLTVVCKDEAQAQQAITATFAEMERLVMLFNWRQPDSPLALLNQTGTLRHPPAPLVDLLREAYAVSERSGGAFDITVQPLLTALRQGEDPNSVRPLVDYRQLHISSQQIELAPGMQVTLDSIAKGRVVDGAAAVLRARGFHNILVEAGGDLAAQGTRAAGQAWRVGLTHPRQTNETLRVLSLANQAAATSGDYQHRFSQDFASHHIIDPRRGISPVELASVTVLAPTATLADALSTAVMVLGPKQGIDLIEKLPQTSALVVTKQMEIIRSAHFPAAG